MIHQVSLLIHIAMFIISDVHTNRKSVQMKLGVDTKKSNIAEDQIMEGNEGF